MTKAVQYMITNQWNYGLIRNVTQKLSNSTSSKIILELNNESGNLKSPISILRLPVFINQKIRIVFLNEKEDELNRDILTLENILKDYIKRTTTEEEKWRKQL